MIAARNIGCELQGKTILSDVSFAAAAGDFWLIFGANGAGKTTLTRILGGYIHGYTGQALVDGADVRHLGRRQIARRLAYLPQSDEFTLPLAVRDILLAGRYPYAELFHGYSDQDRRMFAEVTARFRLQEFLERDIRTLSGGERKRVLLAAALIQDVPVIVLDEPLNFLDPGAALHLMQILAQLAAEGKTILAVSHQLEFFYPRVSHMLALQTGRVLYAGEKRFDPAVFEAAYGVRYHLYRHDTAEHLFLHG